MDKPPFEHVCIHGVRIESTSRTGALEYILGRLGQKSDGLPLAVFTPNAEIIYRCSRDRRLRELVNSSELSLPDGVGVVWAARLLGSPCPEDRGLSSARQCSAGAPGRVGVFCWAAGWGLPRLRPGALPCVSAGCRFSARTTAILTHPVESREVISKFRDPARGAYSMSRISAAGGVDYIKPSGTLRVRVMMALGSSLDVWSGRVRRAPGFLRSAGLEWLWRWHAPDKACPRSLASCLHRAYFARETAHTAGRRAPVFVILHTKLQAFL